MKALVLQNPGQASIETVPDPVLTRGDVLLKVRMVGFCGSDLNSFRGLNPLVTFPRIPGHEVSATVVQGDNEFPAGMDVALSPYTSCGKCASCRRGRPNACQFNQTLGVQRDGALTEFVVMPREKLYSAKLTPKELCLVEPLTVGFHAVRRGRVTADDTVAIFGCGGVGLGAVAASHSRGARTICIDVDDEKLELAQLAGGDHAINTVRETSHERLLEITDGRGPDVVIEAIGTPATFRAAVEEVAFTGRVVYIGYAKEPVSYETRLFVQKELDILGSRNAQAEDFEAVINLLEGHRFPVDEAVSLIVALDEAPHALRSWSENPSRFKKNSGFPGLATMSAYIPESTTTVSPKASTGSLFRTADGRNMAITFALITSLFLLWGFCNGMIDILNKHFQDTLRINKEQSGLVQAANYLAYFLMAIPAGFIAKKAGYKTGILVGLSLIAAGAFWFIPATRIGSYSAFLLGLFVIAAGMTCLETIANPYATVLGAPETGPTRINIAQTFNGVGWILGPIVGGYFVFAGAEGSTSHAGLTTPYMGIGIFVAFLLVIFAFARVPDLHAEDETRLSKAVLNRLKPTGGQLAGIAVVLAAICGLLYFFIVPILKLLWTLLQMNEALFPLTKYGILVIAYIASFLMISRHWDMFRRKHFTLGVAAQFFYVAAQTGIFSFFVNYVLENDPGVTRLQASKWLGGIGFVLFMIGRMCGSAVISQFKPDRVLAAYSVMNVILVGIATTGGKVGMYAMFASFFFMSIGFPTIFALGIRGLGEHTKLGSSLIVMSIVGGAIAPPFMGHIADLHSMRIGFVVPLVCFVFVALYGFTWAKLTTLDALPGDAN